ncbi:MAG: FAD-linked oxidase C-terminal domain-containing protein [Planctomycetota bacterium]
MAQYLSRMIQELVRLLGADGVLRHPAELMVYECDGLTHLKQRPSAVALPRTTDEVAAIVKLCRHEGVPFVPRGAGTGLSGGALAKPGSIVIELARMNRILSIAADERLAVVQAGVVNAVLSRAVRPFGLHYAPDPSSQIACTIGGNIAENSGGPHCFKHGATTRHVLALTVVLPSGEIVKLGSPHGEESGYDLVGLMVGSEGTLGIATEATLRLLPLPPKIETLLAAFHSVEDACEVVSRIVASGVTAAALEMLDRLTIEAVEASVFAAGYPQDAGAVLLIELDGHPAQVASDAARVEAIVSAAPALFLKRAQNEQERLKLWKGRKGAFGALGRLAPDLYVLDTVVPRTRLPDVLRAVLEIGRSNRVRLSNVFHAGDGNLHPNISYDGRDQDELARVVKASGEIVRACLDAGGALSGEHGIGLEKRDYMSLLFSADDLSMMARVRDLFDPDHLCNPNKVLPQTKACAEYRRDQAHLLTAE